MSQPLRTTKELHQRRTPQALLAVPNVLARPQALRTAVEEVWLEAERHGN